MRKRNGSMLALALGVSAMVSCEQTGTSYYTYTPAATVRCPACDAELGVLGAESFGMEGIQRTKPAYAWVCYRHGVIATGNSRSIQSSSCSHACSKAPAYVSPGNPSYRGNVILMCSGCGAGGKVLLESGGSRRTFYPGN